MKHFVVLYFEDFYSWMVAGFSLCGAAWGRAKGHRGQQQQGICPWHLATWGPVGGIWRQGWGHGGWCPLPPLAPPMFLLFKIMFCQLENPVIL